MGAALAGGETEQVLAALDRLPWTFRWKTDGLYAAGLGLRIGASSLTLGRRDVTVPGDDYRLPEPPLGQLTAESRGGGKSTSPGRNLLDGSRPPRLLLNE